MYINTYNPTSAHYSYFQDTAFSAPDASLVSPSPVTWQNQLLLYALCILMKLLKATFSSQGCLSIIHLMKVSS